MRPFLLLEVLIAFTLVALCGIPLIVQPMKSYRSEIALLEEVELQRLADYSFSEIKESMLSHKISWEKLPAMNQTTGPFKLGTEMIQVPGREPKKIERSYTLFGKGEKESENGEIYRMIYVKLQFSPPLKKAPTYRVAVQRM